MRAIKSEKTVKTNICPLIVLTDRKE